MTELAFCTSCSLLDRVCEMQTKLIPQNFIFHGRGLLAIYEQWTLYLSIVVCSPYCPSSFTKWIFKKNNYSNRRKKKTNFSKSASYHFFFKLSMNNLENTPFPTKKVIHFCRTTPLSPKMSMSPKIIFRGCSGKYWFFSKKLINEKYLEPHFLQKKLLFFSPEVPFLSNPSRLPTNDFLYFFFFFFF